MKTLASLIPKLNEVLQGSLSRISKDSFDRWQKSLSVQGNYKTHAPPGKPPYRQSGDLVDSLYRKAIPNGFELVSTAPEGIYQEFGNDSGTLAPRPHAQPEVDRVKATGLRQAAKYFEANFRG